MILTPDPSLEVKFELYDKDIDSDDFLGRLVVAQTNTVKTPITTFYYLLLLFIKK